MVHWRDQLWCDLQLQKNWKLRIEMYIVLLLGYNQSALWTTARLAKATKTEI